MLSAVAGLIEVAQNGAPEDHTWVRAEFSGRLYRRKDTGESYIAEE